MGLWLDVAFVQADIERVELVIVKLFEERGRSRIHPTPRKPAKMDAMQYGDTSTKRWGALLVPGAPKWTCILTAPMQLLVEDNGAMLGRLARTLKAPAFQYDVYDGDSHRLFEADAKGKVRRSGFLSRELDEGFEPEDVVEIAFAIDGSIEADVAPEIQRRYGGKNWRLCNNLSIVENLIPHRPLDGTVMIVAEKG